MKHNKLRYFFIMALGVIMNEGLYGIARAIHAPFWLDTSGTAAAALFLEPTAGLIVGLINNFYMAISTGDASNLFYYAASAAVAVIVGVGMRDPSGRICWKNLLPVMVIIVVVETLIVTPLSLWMDNGMLTTVWEKIIYSKLCSDWGWSKLWGVFGATLLIKIPDTLASAAILVGMNALLPQALKNPEDRKPPKQPSSPDAIQ
ncbi:MAG: hypothetical protein PHI94_04570 [Eubacteriaceae bacterium]|jgi:energy-coupling factor transport system substrate-specific component|nr:hypothetical protein [Eubacteriaceae bacterium]MDD4508375.1 hypothetical protein [Eubacteriaceae bacterium]